MSTILWLACCALIGYCARRQGRSALLWGLVSLVFTPVIAGLTLALLSLTAGKPETSSSASGGAGSHDRYGSCGGEDVVYCPECRYEVSPGDTYCPRCGEMILR